VAVLEFGAHLVGRIRPTIGLVLRDALSHGGLSGARGPACIGCRLGVGAPFGHLG